MTREFLDRALTVSAPDGVEVHYLRREDLIAMRREVGRPKDLRRAEELERL
jgi:predicted nucleotidyltransferase